MHLHKKKRDVDSLEKQQRREAKKLAVKMGSVKDVETVLVPILRSKMIPPSQEEDYESGETRVNMVRPSQEKDEE
jgi:hypothetical protein